MLRPLVIQSTPQPWKLLFTVTVSIGSGRGKNQVDNELTPIPALLNHGQELSRSDEAPLNGRHDGMPAFAVPGSAIQAANLGFNRLPAYTYNPNGHFTHSHVTWDRDTAAAQTEGPFLEARPPQGFEFRSDFEQCANQEQPVAGLQALSLYEKPVIRPPPGLGFTPRSRPTQITKRPPPGLGFTPRSRKPESNEQAQEPLLTERLRQGQCQCCPNGRHGPPPRSIHPQKDEPQRVQPKIRVNGPLESEFHKWIISKAAKPSNTDSVRPPSKPSAMTPEERRLARKAGREAMRREMDAEDDEAIAARQQIW